MIQPTNPLVIFDTSKGTSAASPILGPSKHGGPKIRMLDSVEPNNEKRQQLYVDMWCFCMIRPKINTSSNDSCSYHKNMPWFSISNMTKFFLHPPLPLHRLTLEECRTFFTSHPGFRFAACLTQQGATGNVASRSPKIGLGSSRDSIVYHIVQQKKPCTCYVYEYFYTFISIYLTFTAK